MKFLENEKKIRNIMRLEVLPKSENESFARSTVAAFAAQLNPTLDEINDIKTAVSEAVTNCVVHAYRGATKPHQTQLAAAQRIVIECELYDDALTVAITDFGVGIPNIDRALEPFYTTKPDEERSGMGFTVMQSFMDTLRVENNKSGGTTVTMQKFFAGKGTTKGSRAEVAEPHVG